MYMEKHVRFWYETHFIRNTDRPYMTNNLYDLMDKEDQLKREVEHFEVMDLGKNVMEVFEGLNMAG